MKFSIKDFFSKCDQIHSFLRHVLFFECAHFALLQKQKNIRSAKLKQWKSDCEFQMLLWTPVYL